MQCFLNVPCISILSRDVSIICQVSETQKASLIPLTIVNIPYLIPLTIVYIPYLKYLTVRREDNGQLLCYLRSELWQFKGSVGEMFHQFPTYCILLPDIMTNELSIC